MQRQRPEQPVAEVEQVHPLVEQLAAARHLGHGAPLAVVAGPAAVAVAGAQVHRLAVQAVAHLGDRPHDPGVEAVVEAHLHAAAGGGGGGGDAVDLRDGAPGGLLHQDVGSRRRAPRQAASASASWVVATITTSGRLREHRVEVGDRPAAGLGREHLGAGRVGVARPRRRGPARARRRAFGPSGRSRRCPPTGRHAYSWPKQPWKSKPKRTSGAPAPAMRLAHAARLGRVEQQEAAAAGARPACRRPPRGRGRARRARRTRPVVMPGRAARAC